MEALLHARGSMASREERPQVLEVPKIAVARDGEVRIFILYQYIKTIPSRTCAVSDQSSGDLLQVRTLSAALLKSSNKQTSGALLWYLHRFSPQSCIS